MKKLFTVISDECEVVNHKQAHTVKRQVQHFIDGSTRVLCRLQKDGMCKYKQEFIEEGLTKKNKCHGLIDPKK